MVRTCVSPVIKKITGFIPVSTSKQYSSVSSIPSTFSLGIPYALRSTQTYVSDCNGNIQFKPFIKPSNLTPWNESI